MSILLAVLLIILKIFWGIFSLIGVAALVMAMKTAKRWPERTIIALVLVSFIAWAIF